MIDVSEINMISKYLATVTPFPFSISTDFKFPLVILHHMHIISSDAENKTFISESIVPDSNKICVPSFKNSLSLFNFSSLFSCVQNANCAKSLDEINGNLPEFVIRRVTTAATASESTFCPPPDSSWNYKNTIVLKTRCLHTGNSTYYENVLACSQISSSYIRLIYANPESVASFLNTKAEVYLMKIPV